MGDERQLYVTRCFTSLGNDSEPWSDGNATKSLSIEARAIRQDANTKQTWNDDFDRRSRRSGRVQVSQSRESLQVN